VKTSGRKGEKRKGGKRKKGLISLLHYEEKKKKKGGILHRSPEDSAGEGGGKKKRGRARRKVASTIAPIPTMDREGKERESGGIIMRAIRSGRAVKEKERGEKNELLVH